MDAINATVDLPKDEAEIAVRAALAAQGFGVPTASDVARTRMTIARDALAGT